MMLMPVAGCVHLILVGEDLLDHFTADDFFDAIGRIEDEHHETQKRHSEEVVKPAPNGQRAPGCNTPPRLNVTEIRSVVISRH